MTSKASSIRDTLIEDYFEDWQAARPTTPKFETRQPEPHTKGARVSNETPHKNGQKTVSRTIFPSLKTLTSTFHWRIHPQWPTYKTNWRCCLVLTQREITKQFTYAVKWAQQWGYNIMQLEWRLQNFQHDLHIVKIWPSTPPSLTSEAKKCQQNSE